MYDICMQVIRMDRVRYQTTTKKHRLFTSEPINDKGVKRVPGIGQVYGDRLQHAGFSKAQSVLDKFLALERNEALFKQWLKDTCGADSKNQHECYYALDEWCNQYLHYAREPYH